MIGIGLATILTSVSYLTPRFALSLPATTNAFCGFSFPLGKQVKKQNRIARERHKSYDIGPPKRAVEKTRHGSRSSLRLLFLLAGGSCQSTYENQRQIALVPSISCHTDADMYLAHHTQTMLSQSLHYFGGRHSTPAVWIRSSRHFRPCGFCRDSLSDLLY